MVNNVLLTDYQEILAFAPEHKKMFEIYDSPFMFAVDGKAVIVGELEMANQWIYIKNMNSLEERRGYGKNFIYYLLHELGIKEINGEAIPDAVPFWFKMGAKFNQKAFDEFLESEEDDFLIPFTISA